MGAQHGSNYCQCHRLFPSPPPLPLITADCIPPPPSPLSQLIVSDLM
uniref:Uncharacterized protein n=1 Tax=Lepeophtheirus salmonis TaxID=72036 RepID=A0A0K2V5M3_LEPSM